MKTDNATKPTKPVIIYDGECNFCLNGICRIQNKDQADQFTYTPKQIPDLYAHYPQLEAIESKEGMRFIDANGKVYCGADTIYQIYRRLGTVSLCHMDLPCACHSDAAERGHT